MTRSLILISALTPMLAAAGTDDHAGVTAYRAGSNEASSVKCGDPVLKASYERALNHRDKAARAMSDENQNLNKLRGKADDLESQVWFHPGYVPTDLAQFASDMGAAAVNGGDLRASKLGLSGHSGERIQKLLASLKAGGSPSEIMKQHPGMTYGSLKFAIYNLRDYRDSKSPITPDYVVDDNDGIADMQSSTQSPHVASVALPKNSKEWLDAAEKQDETIVGAVKKELASYQEKMDKQQIRIPLISGENEATSKLYGDVYASDVRMATAQAENQYWGRITKMIADVCAQPGN